MPRRILTFMKVSIHSDLHNEHRAEEILPVVPEADVLVFAGDVTKGSKAPDYYRKVGEANPNAKILYILGNHEHYGGQVEDIIKLNRDAFSDNDQIHFLENSHILINGVEFVGATLWTDFNLAKSPEQISLIERRISDFYEIRYGSRKGLIRANGGMKTMFAESHRYIKDRLTISQASRKVVVTHFSPHPSLGHTDFPDSDFRAYFIANCRDLFRLQPDLWIYGHTHCNEYAGKRVDDVWVEVNCGGYSTESTGYQRDHLVSI